MIDYYPGHDEFNRSNDWPNEPRWIPYLTELQKLPQVKHFFIYTPNEDKRSDLRRNVFPDEDNMIEKLFFPAHYPWGSFAIIRSDRMYIVYKGEYPTSYILEQLGKK